MQTLSSHLKRALYSNSQEISFSREPIADSEPLSDGTYVAGLGGPMAPQQILIIPFVEGGPECGCKMRVSGWWLVGKAGDTTNLVYIRLTLAQFDVVASRFSGLGGRFLKSNEFCAGQLTLTAGDVGKHGLIVNDGLIAYTKIDLQGCQKFQFEFAQGEQRPGFGNALFAVTSDD